MDNVMVHNFDFKGCIFDGKIACRECSFIRFNDKRFNNLNFVTLSHSPFFPDKLDRFYICKCEYCKQFAFLLTEDAGLFFNSMGVKSSSITTLDEFKESLKPRRL